MTQTGAGGPEAPIAADLRDDETLDDAFHVGDATVGVTDRRLLVRQAGRTRAVDLTNVRRVRERTLQDRRRLVPCLQWVLVAAVLLGAWLFVPLENVSGTVVATPGGDFVDFYNAVRTLVDLLEYVDEAFLVVGILALGAAGWRLVSFLRDRETVLEIAVAGADPVHLPPPADPTAVDRLRGAVGARSRTGTD